jgi:hypothetical protein
MRGRRHNRREDGLADECAAFLTGTLTDRWEADGLAVPIWAWTNLLAHGSRGMIEDAVSRPSRHRLLTRCWWIARAQLADLILEMTDSSSLSDLQESVLIPLELELASRTDVPFWTARQWVNTVTSELHRYDHTSQSS